MEGELNSHNSNNGREEGTRQRKTEGKGAERKEKISTVVEESIYRRQKGEASTVRAK